MRTKLYLASVAKLRDEALFYGLLPTVAAARREKIARCRDAGQKRLLLGAGLLLNRALAAEGLTAPDYAETPEGKPYLPSLPDFRFSLSHSGETVLCAVSERELGCDVERVRDFDIGIARRFFHETESASLFSLPEGERQTAFFRLWTLKESYMKARGLGFALPMSAFAISVSGSIRVFDDGDGRDWRFLSFREGDCFYALCAEDADRDVPVIRVDLSEERTRSV